MATAEQIKAARALLRMEQDELAKRAGISVTTVRRLEAAGDYAVAEETAGGVRAALEEAGVEFIHDGVRLKPAHDADALFAKLYAIAEASAEALRARQPLTDADLYGDDGLPA
ncbi:helix-turn-helix transcriptional regulator [Rhodomicrobium sp. Az07]|uniref:helix-turn-helix transcriptional regulator n=1 Tax=Rhodomicrobium sp. Az07 TaxID=2839034 RepID=UPI001BE8750F|nr:helix-turn-helix transcriptional regulator [Rhodomicrobium sp. Az07]MBT3069866.1 helix-turn-helix transcriptional regulator [Rhodomicrobium sp. Az07]